MATERGKTHQPPEKKRKSHQRKPLPFLPHEIVVEILSRLPVRSLLRFRCVCKAWRSLISNPQFVKTHLNISSKVDNFAQFSGRRIILNPSCHRYNLKLRSCSPYSVFDVPFVNSEELYYPLKDSRSSVRIIGCCNGLLCMSFSTDDRIFIWNPATRKSKRLPSPRMKFGMAMSEAYGFGYDEFTDDYKLLIVCTYSQSKETETKVYECRTNSWRRIQDFPFGPTTSGVFFNKALHWKFLRRKTPSGNKTHICSMDLAKETYREVPGPDFGNDYYALTLGVWEECLCILCCYYYGVTRADLWVMKEYGVRDSWSKLVCIPYLICPADSYYSPLCISKDGEILLLFGGRLEIYNPKHGTFRNLVINEIGSCVQAGTYIESLVSPSTDYVERVASPMRNKRKVRPKYQTQAM